MPKVTSKRFKKSKKPNEEVFSVEKITQKKIQDGKVFYLLKWHGYPESENTWEPEENLSCPDLIERYEASLKAAGRDSPRDTAQVTHRSPTKVLDGISMTRTSESNNSHENNAKKDKERKKPKLTKTNFEKKSKNATLSGRSSSLGSLSEDDKKANENGEIVKKEDEPILEYKSGFAKNWEAEEILGATEDKEQLLFLIKWYA